MKKLIWALALALALCFVCTSALAAVEVDYDAAGILYWNNYKTISFPQTGSASKYEEWQLFPITAKYSDIEDLDVDGKGNVVDGNAIVGVIKDSGNCETENWIVIYPTNMDEFSTNNKKDVERYDNTLDKKAQGYYGIPSENKGAYAKKITLADLKEAGFTKADEIYKALMAGKHVYDYEVIKEANCEENGSVLPVCRVCGYEAAVVTTTVKHESYATEQNVANMKNHEVGYKTKTIKNEKGEVVVYTITKLPNCSETGTYVGECKLCHKKDVTFEIPKDPATHVWGAWQIDKAATCTKQGQRYRICTLCLVAKESGTIDPLGHNWSFTYVKEPTCTETGTATLAKCTRCSATVSAARVNAGTQTKPAPYKVNDVVVTDWEIDTTKDGTAYFLMNINPNNHPSMYWIDVADEEAVEAAEIDISEDITKKAKAATCTKDGLRVYVCSKCGEIANTSVIPATGHNMKTIYRYTDADGATAYTDTLDCHDGPDGKPIAYQVAKYCKNEIGTDYASIPEKDWTQTKAPDHVWGEWIMRNAPVLEGAGKTPGYWIRECTVCHQNDEYKDYTAPKAEPKTEDPKTEDPKTEDKTADPTTEKTEDKTADPTVEKTEDKTADKTEEKTADKTEEKTADKTEEKTADKTEEKTADKTEEKTADKTEEKTAEKTEEKTEEPKKNGIVKDNDGKYRAYKDGEVDTTVSGIVDYDGGKFIFANGVLQDVDGLWQDPATKEWGFYADGQFQDKTGFAEYDGYWFMLKDGKLDTTANGIYDYDGGKFVFAAGQLQKNLNGLWLDPATNEWVFVAGGQVQTQYSGVAEYNGEFFVLKDGKLDKKDGTVEYDGKTFLVSNGQLYPMPVAETPAEEAAA